MNSVSIPMWRAGGLLSIGEVLQVIAPHATHWCLLEFEGVGIAPRGMPMQDFEALVQDEGFCMQAEELHRFASNIEETWNCLLVGLTSERKISREDLIGDREEVVMVLEAHDSGEWVLRARDSTLLELVSKHFALEYQEPAQP